MGGWPWTGRGQETRIGNATRNKGDKWTTSIAISAKLTWTFGRDTSKCARQ